MMLQLRKVAILTGSGHYYCAGVDLSGTLKPGLPQKVWNQIKTENQYCKLHHLHLVTVLLQLIVYLFSILCSV